MRRAGCGAPSTHGDSRGSGVPGALGALSRAQSRRSAGGFCLAYDDSKRKLGAAGSALRGRIVAHCSACAGRRRACSIASRAAPSAAGTRPALVSSRASRCAACCTTPLARCVGATSVARCFNGMGGVPPSLARAFGCTPPLSAGGGGAVGVPGRTGTPSMHPLDLSGGTLRSGASAANARRCLDGLKPRRKVRGCAVCSSACIRTPNR